MSLEVSVELLDGSGAPVQGEVVFRQMETIAKGEASIVIVSGQTGVIADDGTYRVTERVLGRPAVQKYVQVVAADWASPPVAYELLPEVAFDQDCWDAHPAILSRPAFDDTAILARVGTLEQELMRVVMRVGEDFVAIERAAARESQRNTVDEQNLTAALLRIGSQEDITNALLQDTAEPWVTGTEYNNGDVVSNQGRLWLALENHITSVTPGSDPLKWVDLGLPAAFQRDKDLAGQVAALTSRVAALEHKP